MIKNGTHMRNWASPGEYLKIAQNDGFLWAFVERSLAFRLNLRFAINASLDRRSKSGGGSDFIFDSSGNLSCSVTESSNDSSL